MVGFEGVVGDIKGYYAYPEVVSGNTDVVIIESKGKTPREVRMDAELKVQQSLDFSMLSALLIGEDTAKDGLDKYLDLYYRSPKNSISSLLIIVEGEVKDYLTASKMWGSEVGVYFKRMIESAEQYSIVSSYTIQSAGSVLYSEGMDLALPYVKLHKGEEKRPEVGGVALFSKDKFTGRLIEADQSPYLGILSGKHDENIRLSFLYEGKNPLSIRTLDVKKNWKLDGSNKIDLNYEIELEIDEYSEAGFRHSDLVKKIESFLNKEIEDKMKEIIKILQEEKSDVLGIGRFVREKNYKMYDQEEWQDHFANLDINVNVKTKILRVGLIH